MDSQKSMSIEEARKLARFISKRFNIRSSDEWLSFIRGDHFPKTEFLSFEEARRVIKKLGIKNVKEWKTYCDEGYHILQNIPSHPAKAYKNKWVSWGDFLGGKHEVPSKFISFQEAAGIVRTLGFESCKDWQEFCASGEKPKEIPHSPQKIYKSEWIGWNYFLGIGLYRQEFYMEVPFSEIRETIENEIEWDLNNIGGMIESFREEFDTDKEILEGYKDEPGLFLRGLEKYLKGHPRGEDE